MKRGQGLPITIIIVAALGIIVLVVIGAIFGGQIFKFGRAATECPGKCVLNEALKSPPVGASLGTFDLRVDGKCISGIETPLSGTYLARGTPKDAHLDEWKCDVCCVATG